MTIWTRNKVQGTRHKEQGTRHKIQELLTTDSNLPVTINPKFEFETRTSNIQHPASSILLRCARNDEPHSVRKDFTGFAIAALMAWKLMVNKAINSAITPANTNTHQLISIL